MASMVDYFLNINGIQGESQDSQFQNQIEVEGFIWNELQTGSFSSNQGGGSGKVSMGDFTFFMKTNKASPKLFLACANGQHITNAVLTCRKAGGGQQVFYTITLQPVLVSHYQTASGNLSGIFFDKQGNLAGDVGSELPSTENAIPMDRVSLSFGSIQVQYQPQDASGSTGGPIIAGWNLMQNTAM